MISIHALFENVDSVQSKISPWQSKNHTIVFDPENVINKEVPFARSPASLAKAENRVTSVKTTDGELSFSDLFVMCIIVNWLKTRTWNYMIPARRELLRYTNALKRKRTDDDIIKNFKRTKSVGLSIRNKNKPLYTKEQLAEINRVQRKQGLNDLI